ncbi:hypothetical protein KVR01_004370 [Diaporthe batatas]|uniref:uncharacterized protein n=1 Tax=Diaporthe batatas TaxID=748121 RepID=UPI001D0456FF|nr:uncharacterized protein KVR01_004370 [Diaporthe batatas]KAG8165818.1 hypothetical protein KVR01_004370 [Diaporthe batatas]
MRIIIRRAAGLRSNPCPLLQVRSFHHTTVVTAAGVHANEGDVNEAQTSSQERDTKSPLISDSSVKSTNAAKKKTVAEMDEELRRKLEGISGEGGASGIEYEGGKAEGLKRGVKSNMFRVI